MEPGDVFAGRFAIERRAGAGGMGAVFRALDRVTGEPVAVKVLHSQSERDAARFAHEARVLAELSHPAVVRYVAHGTWESTPWLAMEWLEGEDLARRLERAALTPAAALEMLARVADALAAAHARAVVHRDVKPANLYLAGGDPARVKVLDFGVARLREASRATRTGAVIGTPGYMSPEQVRSEPDVDGRADLFALGCVLFECVTGQRPFEGEHVMAVLAKVLLADAPRLAHARPGVTPALDALCARLLAKDPAARPADARAVADELRALARSPELAALEAAVRGGDGAAHVEALTDGEQALFCVVLAEPRADVTDLAAHALAAPASVDALGATAAGARLIPRGDLARHETVRLGPEGSVAAAGDAIRDSASRNREPGAAGALEAVIAEHGARSERLVDGSTVVVLAPEGTATDLAARAARCALAIEPLAPGVAMAVSLGRAEVTRALSVAAVLDRAAGALARARRADARGGIWLEDSVAGLLDVRFSTRAEPAGLRLLAERALLEPPRTVLGRATPCVGREREIASLLALWDEAVDEPVARVALVTGAAGVGKSRLRQEVLASLARRDEPPAVWIARGDPMRAGSPFALLAQALRRAAEVGEGEPLESRQAKLRRFVARRVSEPDATRVAEFLGELAGVPFSDEARPQLRAARADPRLLGDQMRRALEDVIAAECAARPLLLVLDDLHWGDLPSVGFLDAALRNLADRPWMVLALARPEVDEVFPALWRERGVHPVRLLELTRKASERLARVLLAERAEREPALLARVLERAAGNPFFLEEIARALAGGDGTDALPASVLAMAQAGIAALPADERRVLRAASVFGETFCLEGVRALLGGETAAALEDALADLARREVVLRRAGAHLAGEAFAFRHALLREAAYSTLTESDRSLAHRLAGAWLEGQGESDALALALHFERGGASERAARFFLRAAEQALGGDDLASAVARAERGIGCGASGETLGALRYVLAEAHGWRGDHVQAEAAGRLAMEALPAHSPQWYQAAWRVVASAYRNRATDLAPLRALFDALLAPSATGGGARVVACARAAMLLLRGGYEPAARAMFQHIQDAAATVDLAAPGVAPWISSARRAWAEFLRQPDVALAHAAEAAAAFERAGDRRHACEQRSRVGYGLMELGDMAGAERAFRDVIALAERMGLRGSAAQARAYLANVLGALGRAAEGVELARASRDDGAAQGDRWLHAVASCYLVALLRRTGALAEAEREARAALDSTADAAGFLGMLRVQLGAVLLAQGRGAEARATLEDALAALGPDAVAADYFDEGLVRRHLAEALWHTGERAQARSVLAEVRARLAERVGRLGDAARGDAFLRGVPENARVLELLEAWSAAAT